MQLPEGKSWITHERDIFPVEKDHMIDVGDQKDFIEQEYDLDLTPSMPLPSTKAYQDIYDILVESGWIRIDKHSSYVTITAKSMDYNVLKVVEDILFDLPFDIDIVLGFFGGEVKYYEFKVEDFVKSGMGLGDFLKSHQFASSKNWYKIALMGVNHAY